MNERLRGVLQVVLASVGYGFTGLFGKRAFAAGFGVGPLLAFRYSLAALVLAVVFVLFSRGSFKMSPGQRAIAFVLGALNCALSSLLYFTAIQGLSVALAALLLYTFPLWALLLNFVFGERITPTQAAGTAIALVGLAVLLWGEIRFASWQAVAAGIGAGLSYGAYLVMAGRWMQKAPAEGSGFWVIVGAAVSLNAVYHPHVSRLGHAPASQWLWLLGLVVVATIAPLLLVQSGLQKLSSTEAAVFSLVEPVTAVCVANVFLGEQLGHRQLLGGFLVLLSLVFLSQRHRPAPAAV